MIFALMLYAIVGLAILSVVGDVVVAIERMFRR